MPELELAHALRECKGHSLRIAYRSHAAVVPVVVGDRALVGDRANFPDVVLGQRTRRRRRWADVDIGCRAPAIDRNASSGGVADLKA